MRSSFERASKALAGTLRCRSEGASTRSVHAGKGLNHREEIYPLLASLIRAELTHRQSRSINYSISGARFPVLKDLDAFIFDGTPVDEGHIRELAAGEFIDARRNLILIGGPGRTEPALGGRHHLRRDHRRLRLRCRHP